MGIRAISNDLKITPIGQVVAGSGLFPSSADFFLREIWDRWPSLEQLLPAQLRIANDDEEPEDFDISDIAFALFHLTLTSPEFESVEPPAYRFIPYQLGERRKTDRATRLEHVLSVQPWDRNVFAVNAADISVDWINGHPLRDLEGRFLDLRGGSLMLLFRDLGQVLYGVMELLLAVTNPNLSIDDQVPTFQTDKDRRKSIRRLIGVLRQLCIRLDAGVPDDVAWLSAILDDSANRVRRRLLNSVQIMALKRGGFSAPNAILDDGRFSDLVAVLRGVHSEADQFARRLKEGISRWREEKRENLKSRQMSRLPAICHDPLNQFYELRGDEFESCVESVMECLNLEIEDRDGPGKTSFPDFVMKIFTSADLVIECKSKDGKRFVAFNSATDVIRKASVNGFQDSFKVTVCQPYCSPDIARKIQSCDELSVVDPEDLAEAFVRIYESKLSLNDFFNWITQPGQPKREHLPYNSRRV